MKRVHKTFVLSKDNEVLATFGNLRKLVNFLPKKQIPSYWTLIRIKENTIECNRGYKIYKVKHY
jgi:hypothetical protein